MKIKEIMLKGFKCFKDETLISFDDLTCFVGTNGVGKTTALEALGKIFGDTQELRRIDYNDFYVDPNENLSEIDTKEFIIAVTFSFPELDSPYSSLEQIPLIFRNMSYFKEDKKLYSTIELLAKWEKNGTSDGEITTEYNWLLSDKKQKLNARDKGLIRLYYIPAVRNPEKEIRIIAGTVFKNILDLIDWGDDLRTKVTEQSTDLITTIESADGIQTIESELTTFWRDFTSSDFYTELRIHPSETDIEQVVKNLVIRLKSIDNQQFSVDEISDGNKSLFYLTLLSTFFSLQEKLKKQKSVNGFKTTTLNDNCLTIFALEEPENHLAPHYLGKILNVFNKLNSDNSQTIISSHSPAIISRIEPTKIRFFEKNKQSLTVKSLILPDDQLIAFKFVKEAVQSHPELYFSKLVILGEGDSEQYLIPKLAKLAGINLDINFISFIPLSGRFTNHFWRLLNGLGIPYITLLDFDLGRNTGGEDKIKYVIQQLKDINKLSEAEESYLKNSDFTFQERINLLNSKNVFFSYPIDIDYLMLQNYFNEYTANTRLLGKPRIPSPDNPMRERYDIGAIASLLKKDKDELDLKQVPSELNISDNVLYCYWYRHLFLGEGKPLSHKIAFTKVEETIHSTGTILVFNELLECIKRIINE